MADRSKFIKNTEFALGAAALAFLFALLYLNMLIQSRDPDIWLHLKTGEYIVQNRAVPQEDIFSSTVSGKEWIDHSWLVQVIFYSVFHLSGINSVASLCAVIVLLAFLFLFLSTYEQREYLVLSVLMLTITLLASLIRFNLKPENFSLLFFAIYLYILRKHPHNKIVFILPLIQVIWANCHGFFILGPLLLLIFIVAEKTKRHLWPVFLLACAASFLTPYGYKGVLYPFTIILGSTGKIGIFYKHIIELLPTWQLGPRAFLPYLALIIISLFSFLLNHKKLNPAYIIIWLSLLGISLRINRNVIFFNFAACLFTVDNIRAFWEKEGPKFSRGIPGKAISASKYILIIFTAGWLLQKNAAILNNNPYYYISARDCPDKAAEFILKEGLPENIFNVFNHGSYFIYKLFPRERVFIDGRTELYGGGFFEDYQKILNINEPAINNLLERYKINTVILSDNLPTVSGLMAYLYRRPDWALVYFDEDALIFLRNNERNKALISRLKVDLNNRPVTKTGLSATHARFAWMFYYLGLKEQAINEAKEALKIWERSADAYNVLGRIYTAQKRYAEALENLRLARAYAPSNMETLIGLGDLYMEKREYAEAIRIYKKLVDLYPYKSEPHYLLGKGYHAANNLKAAIKSLKKAVGLNPYKDKYHKELVRVYNKG
ncbi:MAG: tetratricopeptide repeat protein [Candidatus Omnitrophica bacterium]|nr:tetratricopeptide repeat protein [Candidatus Omnitrophota bacterium]